MESNKSSLVEAIGKIVGGIILVAIVILSVSFDLKVQERSNGLLNIQ